MKMGLILLLFFSIQVKAQFPCESENCRNLELSNVKNFAEEIKAIVPSEELISIKKETYKTNPKASFCKRPPEMLDTLVLHHSTTNSTSTAQNINRLHLNRGTSSDPWYMIAYGYVINSPYAGSTRPTPLVSEGRPIDLVGASTGSNAWVDMSTEQKKYWDEGKVVCGKEGQEFKVNPDMVKNGKIKANVTTLGIVINGNYASYSASNPGGYLRNPTPQTIDMIARLSCQLQKQYPSIKNIKWHEYYTPTSCPGSIKKFVDKIIVKTKEYGCEFF